ncbi:hypothetical protein CY34DRAFT_814319 [Suillus luteus UH-Slu-Lm8-n1]|uniref:Uncharacterized protein n=1 Tax=Suillus luteus UH-Slu-Lm8-n1 TaxID=930992 RepID=A0A0C9Z4Q6_9AGAM|nr:hypothetical protein CY34DRAFT_814319 [Suillus luteus UH-Slu-Lm8-n1]
MKKSDTNGRKYMQQRTYHEAPTYDIMAAEALKKEDTERTEFTQQHMQCNTSAQGYSMPNTPITSSHP